MLVLAVVVVLVLVAGGVASKRLLGGGTDDTLSVGGLTFPVYDAPTAKPTRQWTCHAPEGDIEQVVDVSLDAGARAGENGVYLIEDDQLIRYH